MATAAQLAGLCCGSLSRPAAARPSRPPLGTQLKVPSRPAATSSGVSRALRHCTPHADSSPGRQSVGPPLGTCGPADQDLRPALGQQGHISGQVCLLLLRWERAAS